MVIDGRRGDEDEKKGTIRLLGADLKTELARIEALRARHYRLKPDKPVADAARLVADLYCEQMTLVASGAS